MAKLYRLIPDAVTTVCESGLRTDISEDLFYRLGYISKNDHSTNYFRIRNDGKSWAKNTESGIFFFTSPWVCLANLLYLNDTYGTEVARVFEYDIPDEIIEKSARGYGYYKGVAYEEIKIPTRLLVGDGVIFTELSPELKTAMTEIAKKDAIETFHSMKDSVLENEYSKFKNSKDSIFSGKLRDWFFAKPFNRLMERRLSSCGQFFSSDYITGNYVVINSAMHKLFLDFIDEPSENIEKIYSLINCSNDIFTIQDLIAFNKEYGSHDIDSLFMKK